MKARYIRVSTQNQNEARQVAKQHVGELLFIDKISGAIPFAERPEAKKLLDSIERGEIKYVSTSSIDRLGRSTLNVLEVIQYFTEAGISLKVDNLGLESLIDGKENPTFKLIVSVLANISEMERTTLRERQKEGIEQAKKAGVYKGRLKGTSQSKEEVIEKYQEVVRFIKLKKPLRDIAGRCRVSLGTVQKVKKMIG